jgi:hypothetical protein
VSGRDELILLAELGAAFAGFLAIFLIFARREGRFSPIDSLAVRSMILGSFSTVFLSLAPLALAALEVSELAVWRASSALGLLLILSVGVSMALAHRRVPRDVRSDLKPILVVAAWSLATLVTALFIANLAGYFGGPSAGLHISGLVLLLGITALNFSDIAFKRLI